MAIQQAGGDAPVTDLAGHSAPRHWFWAPRLRPGIGLAMDVPGADRPGERRSWWRQPWFRLLACVLLLPALAVLTGTTITILGGFRHLEDMRIQGAIAVLVAIVMLLVVTLVVERRRDPVEIDPRRIGGLGIGLLMGAGLMLASFAIVWGFGGLQVHGTTTGYDFVTAFVLLGAQAGVVEEVLFRWIMFRLPEEYLGTWAATALSAAVFGLIHVSNPEGSLAGGIAIMLEAGILFGLLYALTRSLWVVIGVHAAWNLTQGPLLGITVSGAMEGGWLDTTARGPDLLSGGAFGLEASVVAIMLCLLVSLWAGRELVRRGLVVPPVWVRRRRIREMTAD